MILYASFRTQGFVLHGCIVDTIGIVEFLCQYAAYINEYGKAK
jgi:hypothetical protein